MPLEISPELRLLIRCCQRAFDQSVELSIVDRIDWRLIVQLARYHRVQGLAWNSLWSCAQAVPDQIAKSLSADAQAIAAANLRMAVEAREMRSDFERAGVELLFVKGLTVGALAYPNPMIKMGWDIDVLVAPRELSAAVDLLRGRGYRQVLPRPSADLHSWHGRRKESVWTRDPGIDVELHTRLADNNMLIPGIDVLSPRQEVEIAPGIALPTLARDELFAYLCVHGASSCWFRLKWITDFAALLREAPPGEIERLYDRSRELGAGRAAGQALLLADRLYGTLESSELRDRLQRDRGGRWLAEEALRQVTGPPRDPTAIAFGTARIHWTQFFLLPGLSFKASEAWRQARDAIF